MDAAWATVVAGALGDHVEGSLPPFFDDLVAPLGYADTTGMAVVDEDLRLAGVGMNRCRDATDVVAVAQRKQRQDADGRMLTGMQPAGKIELLLVDGILHEVGDV